MEKLLAYLNALQKEPRQRFVESCCTSEAYLRKAISSGQKLGAGLCIKVDRAESTSIS